MSFHPNDIVRRGRAAGAIVTVVALFLTGAFFRTQILRNQQWVLQSEENRLRQVPLPAPRGIIYDRRGEVIAENVVGYSVSLISQSEDSLRATLARLRSTINLTPNQVEAAVRRYRRDRARPTVIIADASFDVISVLEENRLDYPSLIIQSSPKRFYPDGPAVAAFVGYTGEISERELAQPRYASFKAGQQIGKSGLERQYEEQLGGREGSRFVEVDARHRVVREEGAREDLMPVAGPALHTNIDLKLQRFVHRLFTDSGAQGGVVALDPKTGGVLALYSAPAFDPNRFIGGVPVSYYDSLRTDERRPLYNKAIQGVYPPASTWKLATSIIAMENGIVGINERMPQSCTGGMYFGNRYFRCHERAGHGSLNMIGAIAKSCDVYYYQVGLKIGVARMIAGGTRLGFGQRSGIDLPDEQRSIFPDRVEYYNERYGPRGWTQAILLNLAIGQGENAQTVVNMARFYTALATDGHSAKPEIVRRQPERTKIFDLNAEQWTAVRAALANVVTSQGTAGSAALRGVVLAGKTGTAQHADRSRDHAWFVGFAPADDPRIVVAVFVEYGLHGYTAARLASAIIGQYLGVQPVSVLQTDG